MMMVSIRRVRGELIVMSEDTVQIQEREAFSKITDTDRDRFYLDSGAYGDTTTDDDS